MGPPADAAITLSMLKLPSAHEGEPSEEEVSEAVGEDGGTAEVATPSISSATDSGSGRKVREFLREPYGSGILFPSPSGCGDDGASFRSLLDAEDASLIDVVID